VNSAAAAARAVVNAIKKLICHAARSGFAGPRFFVGSNYRWSISNQPPGTMANAGRSGEIFLICAAAVWGFGEFILRQLQQKSKFAQEAFVFVMRPDPEPNQIVIKLPRQSAMSAADAHRPQFRLLAFKSKRRMLRIGFEKLEIFVGDFLDFRRQCVVMPPVSRRSEIVHGSGLQRPAR
jgi:hypothetical protein